jgi:glycosyltransferase involved in cell wall biosynthesis
VEDLKQAQHVLQNDQPRATQGGWFVSLRTFFQRMGMKIAMMMRAMDTDAGFRTYIEGLLEGMLEIDQKNSYLLFYRTTKWFGRFSSYANVKEVLLPAPHKFIWDQVAVPYRAWQEDADIIFNPKFSVPLISPCPVTMGLQEPAWWTEPEYYERFDVLYQKIMLPLYCRKASHFFPMAKFVLEESRKYLRLPLHNATVTYPAAQDHLQPIEDQETLQQFRTQYQLPEKFILGITRVDHPGLENSSSFYPGKNVHTTLRAFLRCRDAIPHSLVLAGRRVYEYLLHMGFQDTDLQRVHFTNFVPFEDLAKLYSLADVIVVPPYYEGFGFTLLGALSCGCPAIASKTGTCPEVVEGASLLADPHDPADFAAKIMSVLKNEELRQTLRQRGLERAAYFTWERTARLTLQGLTRVVEQAQQLC